MNSKNSLCEFKGEPEIKEAKIELTEISADEKTRRLYEMREDAIRDRISALTGAHKKGKLEGKLEEKLEIAKEMFKNNMDINLIATITKLSLNKLQEIKKSLDKDSK